MAAGGEPPVTHAAHAAGAVMTPNCTGTFPAGAARGGEQAPPYSLTVLPNGREVAVFACVGLGTVGGAGPAQVRAGLSVSFHSVGLHEAASRRG